MAKNVGYFLVGIFLPGFVLALHGYYRPAFSYPILIGFFITLSAYLGYLFRPGSVIIVISFLLLLIVISSLHGLARIRYGPAINRGRLYRFILGGHILLWLSLIAGILFFRQAWLGLEIYYIQGDSMAPTLLPNDIVVAEVISTNERLHANDVVVFTYPKSTKVLIKRYVPIKKADVDDQSSVFVIGDNLENSLDSRLLGAIPRSLIIGKVHWVLVSDVGLAFEKVF